MAKKIKKVSKSRTAKKKSARRATKKAVPAEKSKRVSRSASKKKPSMSVIKNLPIRNPRIIEDTVRETSQDVARELKTFVNKHLSIIMDHSEYYELAKKWTNAGIDMVVKLGKEIEIAQKEYLLIAKDYVRRLME